MPWRLVRLEHAPTSEFPLGSAVRIYLLRVPLQRNGHSDPGIHALDPRRSTLRRFWPSEADLSGYVVRQNARWGLIAIHGSGARDEVGWFEDCALVPAAPVPITESANGTIPFEVAEILRN